MKTFSAIQTFTIFFFFLGNQTAGKKKRLRNGKVRGSHREMRETRPAEADLSGESSGASEVLPSLIANDCNRVDNLETTFEDAIVGFVELFVAIPPARTLTTLFRAFEEGFVEVCDSNNETTPLASPAENSPTETVRFTRHYKQSLFFSFFFSLFSFLFSLFFGLTTVFLSYVFNFIIDC